MCQCTAPVHALLQRRLQVFAVSFSQIFKKVRWPLENGRNWTASRSCRRLPASKCRKFNSILQLFSAVMWEPTILQVRAKSSVKPSVVGSSWGIALSFCLVASLFLFCALSWQWPALRIGYHRLSSRAPNLRPQVARLQKWPELGEVPKQVCFHRLLLGQELLPPRVRRPFWLKAKFVLKFFKACQSLRMKSFFNIFERTCGACAAIDPLNRVS